MNMSSSEEIKELLDEWLGGFDELDPDDVADGYIDPLAIDPKAFGNWKRRSKSKSVDGRTIRVFDNTVMNRRVLVIDDEIQGWLADFKYAFALNQAGADGMFPNRLECVITDLDCFQKEGHASDWHLDFLALPPGFSEEMEAFFSVAGMTEDQARAALINLGFVEDPAFINFMSKHF